MLRARRDGKSVVRRDDRERLDQAAGFDKLHTLGRHDSLARGATDRAIVVVARLGGDQVNALCDIWRSMVVLNMIVVAVPMLTDVAGLMVVSMVAMHVAVQQVARGAGRQIDDRQQTGCQAISKYVQHGSKNAQ